MARDIGDLLNLRWMGISQCTCERHRGIKKEYGNELVNDTRPYDK